MKRNYSGAFFENCFISDKIILGDINSVQNLINLIDINGRVMKNFSGDTALIKATEAGN